MNILVPTDQSQLGEHAVAHAQGLASRLGGRLHLLYVLPDPVPPATIAHLEVYLPPTDPAQFEAEVQSITAQLQAQYPEAEVQVRRAGGKSVPAVICDAARQLGSDLIVMSTHGRSGLTRTLLGSVAESVVRSAPAPVLLVRGEHALP